MASRNYVSDKYAGKPFAALEAKLSKSRQIKRATMQASLTGQIRLV